MKTPTAPHEPGAPLYPPVSPASGSPILNEILHRLSAMEGALELIKSSLVIRREPVDVISLAQRAKEKVREHLKKDKVSK